VTTAGRACACPAWDAAEPRPCRSNSRLSSTASDPVSAAACRACRCAAAVQLLLRNASIAKLLLLLLLLLLCKCSCSASAAALALQVLLLLLLLLLLRCWTRLANYLKNGSIFRFSIYGEKKQ
jgi:hypothetical protein